MHDGMLKRPPRSREEFPVLPGEGPRLATVVRVGKQSLVSALFEPIHSILERQSWKGP